MKEKLKKINIKLVIAVIIHFLITFITDRNIFVFSKINIPNYIFCKIILLFLLTLLWKFMFKLFQKDKNAISYFKKFLLYIIPIFVLLLLCWPGTWTGSDVDLFYSYAIEGNYLYYLNYLTSVFYMISYMLIPVASGAIVVLTIIFGITFSYILKNLNDIYKSKITYLLIIPFFMLNTLFFTFYANRPIMFGVTYLLLISIILIDKIKNNSLTNKKLFALMILTGITSYWRSESIYLILAIPLFIFIVYKLKVNLKNIAKIFGFTILSFSAISLPQKIYEYTVDYVTLTSRNSAIYILPLSYMLTMDLKGENLEEDLAKIDKVIGIEEMKEYPSFNDTYCIWKSNCKKTDYTKEEYKEFQKAYFDVILNNFPEFLKTRTLTFIGASGLYNNTFTTKNLYDENNQIMFEREDTRPFITYKIRKTIYSVLEGRFDEGRSILPYRLLNNLLIPLLIIGALFIYSIIKKKLFYFLLSGMLIGHTMIVFFTAPANYSMYYFNVYLVGLVIGIIFLIDFIYYKREKKSYVLELSKSKKKTKKEPSKIKKLIIQAFKFFGISGIGWLIDFTSYTIMTSLLKIDIMIANIISSFFGITFVYLVSTRKLFQNNSKYNLKVKYVAYILYQIVFVLLTSYIMTLIKKYLLGFDINFVINYVDIITKIIVTPFTMLINFIVMKNLIERI